MKLQCNKCQARFELHRADAEAKCICGSTDVGPDRGPPTAVDSPGLPSAACLRCLRRFRKPTPVCPVCNIPTMERRKRADERVS